MADELKNKQRITSLILEGHSNAVIASRLGLSVRGVKWHVTGILKAYKVNSRAQFIVKNSESYNLKLMQSKIESLTKELETCRLELKNTKDRLYSVSLPMGTK